MLVVNLYGGPGCGKSTTAALVFAHLKIAGVVAEMARETAKFEVWAGNSAALECQPFLFSRQLLKLQVLDHGGCDVAVSDSPLLLSAIYGDMLPPTFREFVESCNDQWPSLDFRLARTKTFEPKGRLHTEAQAIALDNRIEDLLDDVGIKFSHISGGTVIGANRIVDKVLEYLETHGAK